MSSVARSRRINSISTLKVTVNTLDSEVDNVQFDYNTIKTSLQTATSEEALNARVSSVETSINKLNNSSIVDYGFAQGIVANRGWAVHNGWTDINDITTCGSTIALAGTTNLPTNTDNYWVITYCMANSPEEWRAQIAIKIENGATYVRGGSVASPSAWRQVTMTEV